MFLNFGLQLDSFTGSQYTGLRRTVPPFPPEGASVVATMIALPQGGRGGEGKV